MPKVRRGERAPDEGGGADRKSKRAARIERRGTKAQQPDIDDGELERGQHPEVKPEKEQKEIRESEEQLFDTQVRYYKLWFRDEDEANPETKSAHSDRDAASQLLVEERRRLNPSITDEEIEKLNDEIITKANLQGEAEAKSELDAAQAPQKVRTETNVRDRIEKQIEFLKIRLRENWVDALTRGDRGEDMSKLEASRKRIVENLQKLGVIKIEIDALQHQAEDDIRKFSESKGLEQAAIETEITRFQKYDPDTGRNDEAALAASEEAERNLFAHLRQMRPSYVSDSKIKADVARIIEKGTEEARRALHEKQSKIREEKEKANQKTRKEDLENSLFNLFLQVAGMEDYTKSQPEVSKRIRETRKLLEKLGYTKEQLNEIRSRAFESALYRAYIRVSNINDENQYPPAAKKEIANLTRSLRNFRLPAERINEIKSSAAEKKIEPEAAEKEVPPKARLKRKAETPAGIPSELIKASLDIRTFTTRLREGRVTPEQMERLIRIAEAAKQRGSDLGLDKDTIFILSGNKGGISEEAVRKIIENGIKQGKVVLQKKVKEPTPETKPAVEEVSSPAPQVEIAPAPEPVATPKTESTELKEALDEIAGKLETITPEELGIAGAREKVEKATKALLEEAGRIYWQEFTSALSKPEWGMFPEKMKTEMI